MRRVIRNTLLIPNGISGVKLSSKPLTTSRRALSTPSFDGEMSTLYSIVAEQHRHEKGPWAKMLVAAKTALDGRKGDIKLLDLASGAGEPGLTIAKELPKVKVAITDISPDQVALATERAAGHSNVTTNVVDLVDLSMFEDNSFDVVTVCYGYMFCENKQKAFDETHRVLKPGGVLIATYWKKLQSVEFSQRVLEEIYRDGTVPPPSIDPMSLSTDGLCEEFVKTSGFLPCHIITEQSDYPFNLGSDRDMIYKLGVLPMYPKLQELKERGKMVCLKRGEETFWKEMTTAPNVHIDSVGNYIVEENVFEMLTAVKK
mmetsp:Transcript_9750/g.16180  ORF Transcript_9750/g.16180 Transcript_9750/m.16180 type:complete len:315 (-) Transcript_9750:209-1153(-)